MNIECHLTGGSHHPFINFNLGSYPCPGIRLITFDKAPCKGNVISCENVSPQVFHSLFWAVVAEAHEQNESNWSPSEEKQRAAAASLAAKFGETGPHPTKRDDQGRPIQGHYLCPLLLPHSSSLGNIPKGTAGLMPTGSAVVLRRCCCCCCRRCRQGHLYGQQALECALSILLQC